MITYKTGNILDAEAEALVNTVNTVGVMGKGIALQFKKAFPGNFKAYQEAIKEEKIRVGNVFVVPVRSVSGTKYVINFPTKKHWRNSSKLEWIIAGLKALRKEIDNIGIKSVALPPLGCGNGGLNWTDVQQSIENEFRDSDVHVMIFQPTEEIKTILKKQEVKKDVMLTPARAMLLHLLFQYRVLGEFASEFAAEKLCYFLQRFGEKQLKLTFKKGYYGPYSGKVRHVLYALNGKFLKGFEQKQVKPFEVLELIPAKKPEVDQFLKQEVSEVSQERLRQVTAFMQGFQTPLGLELLATIDYLIHETDTFNFEKIKNALYEWSGRKENIFSDKHIEVALQHLEMHKEQLYKSE